MRGRCKFLGGFIPRAIKQRRDGQCGGDAIADQLRKGVAFLEREFVRLEHLDRTAFDVVARPDPALFPTWLMVETKHARVEIRKRIKIDEAGSDQRHAMVDASPDRSGVMMADEDDAASLVDNFTFLVENVSPPHMADHPPGGQKHWPFGGMVYRSFKQRAGDPHSVGRRARGCARRG